MKSGVFTESGHVLLLMTLLLSTGAGSVLLHQASRVSSNRPIERALAARESLADARTLLLAYSANYANLYGPTGAGPGHLPCPDTDEADAADDPRLDGPNPPCGRGKFANGALPRHVTLRRHRHAFHAEPDQRIRYAVSTGYINNPVNRVVNASGASETFGSERTHTIASLSMPVTQGFGSNADRLVTTAIVTRDQLLEVVRPAVVRWFIQHASERLVMDCVEETPCSRLTLLLNDDSADAGVSPTGPIQGADLIEWLSDPDTGFIEAVPASRHWFVRNGWIRNIALSVDDDCLITLPTQSMQPIASRRIPISCELMPTSTGPALPMVITLKRRV